MDKQKSNKQIVLEIEEKINKKNKELEQDIKKLKRNNLKKEMFLDELSKITNNN